AVLKEGSSRPHRLRTRFSEEGLSRLQDLLHRSPRDFGHQRGTWTLELVAQLSFEQGITSTLVSDESVRRALKRLKTNWKRAKHWITSPDPQYLLKKTRTAFFSGRRYFVSCVHAQRWVLICHVLQSSWYGQRYAGRWSTVA